ncbi:MAG: hypothetical protein KBD31_01260 [Proteobacteria bacterium]|nr:hypothetical protein [Pseudomonadota bacterium]
MINKNTKQKNIATLILLMILSVILFSIGFIRVNGANVTSTPKKSAFKSLNEIFDKKSKPKEA